MLWDVSDFIRDFLAPHIATEFSANLNSVVDHWLKKIDVIRLVSWIFRHSFTVVFRMISLNHEEKYS